MTLQDHGLWKQHKLAKVSLVGNLVTNSSPRLHEMKTSTIDPRRSEKRRCYWLRFAQGSDSDHFFYYVGQHILAINMGYFSLFAGLHAKKVALQNKS